MNHRAMYPTKILNMMKEIVSAGGTILDVERYFEEAAITYFGSRQKAIEAKVLRPQNILEVSKNSSDSPTK